MAQSLTQWQQRQWPAVQAELDRVVEQLRSLNPDKIILFGSYARGDFHEDSDVDLLIVQQTGERVFDRVEKVLEVLDTSLPVQPLVYTPQELDLLRSRGSGLIEEAEREGRVLYERPC